MSLLETLKEIENSRIQKICQNARAYKLINVARQTSFFKYIYEQIAMEATFSSTFRITQWETFAIVEKMQWFKFGNHNRNYFLFYFTDI